MGLAGVLPVLVVAIVVVAVVVVLVGGGSLVVSGSGRAELVRGELSGAVAAVRGLLVVVVGGCGGGGRSHGVDGLHGLGQMVAVHVESVLVGGVVHRDGLALGVDVAVRADAAAVRCDALALLQSVVGGERVLERTVVSQRLLVAQDGRVRLLVLAVVVLTLLLVVLGECGGQRGRGDDEDDALLNHTRIGSSDLLCLFVAGYYDGVVHLFCNILGAAFFNL